MNPNLQKIVLNYLDYKLSYNVQLLQKTECTDEYLMFGVIMKIT